MPPTPDPAYTPRRRDGLATVRPPRDPAAQPPVALTGPFGHGTSAARADLGYAARRELGRRVRLVRRHLGPGPYLDFGCGRGALLALLAAHGSASGFVTDAALADIARRAAPGCPVHTTPDAIPSGVFRGVLAPAGPDDATLALWRRLLVRSGGRVLMVGDGDVAPDRLAGAGFRVRWEGREHWRFGPAVVVLEALAPKSHAPKSHVLR